jgi:hypothetical protein
MTQTQQPVAEEASELSILIDNERTSFSPRERIAGTVSWNLDHDVTSLGNQRGREYLSWREIRTVRESLNSRMRCRPRGCRFDRRQSVFGIAPCHRLFSMGSAWLCVSSNRL